jgi:hypothetical protein
MNLTSEQQQRMYDALTRITGYKSLGKLYGDAEKDHPGRHPVEILEMAYSNIIEEAHRGLNTQPKEQR